MNWLDGGISDRLSCHALQLTMILLTEVAPSHPLQESTKLNIALTKVVLKVELLLPRKELGPNPRIKSVRHNLGASVFNILTNRRELEEVTTGDNLLSSVSSRELTHL
jgi:hypothetical protein